MIKPYTAVGLIPTVRGIRKREDIAINLEHLPIWCKAAAWLSSLESAGAPDRAARGRVAGLQRRGARPRPRAVRARMRDRYSRAPRPTRSAPSPASTTPSSWRRPRRIIPTGRIAFSTSASSSIPRARSSCSHYKVSPLFPVEHSVCPHDIFDWWVEKYGLHPRGVLAGGGHGNRPPRDHDGERGLVSRKCPRAGDERRGGGLSRIVSASGDRQRAIRDPEPGARARQQYVYSRAQPGRVLPISG